MKTGQLNPWGCSNGDPPKISVIVPVHNTEKYFQKCMESILNQTFTDFECILVDDCSSDRCPEICDDYAKKDNRVKVIHNSTNQGSSLSRKIGLLNSSGIYIQFIDSDDWVENIMLERLYASAVLNDADIIWCDFYDQYNEYFSQEAENETKIKLFKNIFITAKGLTNSWNKFVKKEILSQVYFPPAMQWEDLVLTVQMAGLSNKITHLKEAFYHVVINPISITRNKKRKIKGMEEIIENLSLAINYCRKYLGSDFNDLEPELSACVNRFKLTSMFFLKDTRKSDLLNSLYPESNKNIFSKAWRTSIFKKLALYACIKKIPGRFIIFDILKLLLEVTKNILMVQSSKSVVFIHKIAINGFWW